LLGKLTYTIAKKSFSKARFPHFGFPLLVYQKPWDAKKVERANNFLAIV
jgi:hypothetical protein